MQGRVKTQESLAVSFSFIAKLFLPKDVLDSLNRTFAKIVRQKIPQGNTFKDVFTLLENYPIVQNSWSIANEKKDVSSVKEFQIIFDAVNYFEMRYLPRQLLLQFLNTIACGVRNRTAEKDIMINLLLLNVTNSTTVKFRDLYTHATKIASIIPIISPSPNIILAEFDELAVKPSLSTIWARGEREEPKSVLPRHYDEEAQFLSTPPTGQSYIRENSPPTDTPATQIQNMHYKSVPQGSEGNVERLKESLRFINDLRGHMFTIFEALVVSDQAHRAILERGKRPGIFRHDALVQTYGLENANMLDDTPDEVILPLLEKRCEELMYAAYHHRFATAAMVDEMTHHMPVFDYTVGSVFSTRSEASVLPFDARSRTAAEFLKYVAKTHQKEGDLSVFLEEIVPMFVVSRPDECVCIVGTDTVAVALSLFAKCAESLERLFHPPPEDRSLNGVLRAAECEAVLKYCQLADSSVADFIEDFLRRFFSRRVNFNESIGDAEARLGAASKDLFAFVMHVTQLSALCARFAAQQKLHIVSKLGRVFARARGPNAAQRCRARLPLYVQAMRKSVMMPLVRIAVDGSNPDVITISPID